MFFFFRNLWFSISFASTVYTLNKVKQFNTTTGMSVTRMIRWQVSFIRFFSVLISVILSVTVICTCNKALQLFKILIGSFIIRNVILYILASHLIFLLIDQFSKTALSVVYKITLFSTTFSITSLFYMLCSHKCVCLYSFLKSSAELATRSKGL